MQHQEVIKTFLLAKQIKVKPIRSVNVDYFVFFGVCGLEVFGLCDLACFDDLCEAFFEPVWCLWRSVFGLCTFAVFFEEVFFLLEVEVRCFFDNLRGATFDGLADLVVFFTEVDFDLVEPDNLGLVFASSLRACRLAISAKIFPPELAFARPDVVFVLFFFGLLLAFFDLLKVDILPPPLAFDSPDVLVLAFFELVLAFFDLLKADIFPPPLAFANPDSFPLVDFELELAFFDLLKADILPPPLAFDSPEVLLLFILELVLAFFDLLKVAIFPPPLGLALLLPILELFDFWEPVIFLELDSFVPIGADFLDEFFERACELSRNTKQ